MIINDLLKAKNMTKYRLSKESGVPQTTILDICSERTSVEKCSAGTLYRLAKTLDVPMEILIEPAMRRDSEPEVDYRVSLKDRT